MANREHLDILKQGIEVWNQWRRDNEGIQPDFSKADLSGSELNRADFRGADFSGANLRRAQFEQAILQKADFTEADLREASLVSANCMGAVFYKANLDKASLIGAEMGRTYLIDARLTRTDLWRATLWGAIVINADFSEASAWETTFAAIDLRQAKGLDRMEHRGPSFVDLHTLVNSEGQVSEVFLRGVGLPDEAITYARSFIQQPIQYHSCFISYSSKDDAFARRLYADLQSNNVRCWFAPEDLKWGGLIRSGIDEAIHMHDKLLLILSKHSIASGWVEREVKTALAREKKEKRTILFPVRVDNAIFDCPYEWATEIKRERNMGDFTRWRTYGEYEKSYMRLLRDLKTKP